MWNVISCYRFHRIYPCEMCIIGCVLVIWSFLDPSYSDSGSFSAQVACFIVGNCSAETIMLSLYVFSLYLDRVIYNCLITWHQVYIYVLQFWMCIGKYLNLYKVEQTNICILWDILYGNLSFICCFYVYYVT